MLGAFTLSVRGENGMNFYHDDCTVPDKGKALIRIGQQISRLSRAPSFCYGGGEANSGCFCGNVQPEDSASIFA